jgi:hypothetical protein
MEIDAENQDQIPSRVNKEYSKRLNFAYLQDRKMLAIKPVEALNWSYGGIFLNTQNSIPITPIKTIQIKQQMKMPVTHHTIKYLPCFNMTALMAGSSALR